MPFLSEIKYRGSAANDFAEVAVPTGSSVANLSLVVYNPNGSIRSTNGLGTLQNTIGNKDVYVVNTGIHKKGAVALVDNGTVLQFVSFDSVVSPTTGPAAGMTSTQIGSTGGNSNASLVSHDGGATYSVQSPPDAGVIPCFAAGTAILTAGGEVPVEELMPDDLVQTLDHGLQPLRWAGSVTVDLRAPGAHVLRPVELRLTGQDCRPVRVSPNHRVLWRSPRNTLLFETEEVLLAARDLLTGDLARIVTDLTTVTYHHIAFDRHEIVFAAGQPMESLLCGIDLLDVVAPQVRTMLQGFPEDPSGQTARPVLRQYEALALLAA